VLLCFTCNRDRAWLLAHIRDALDEALRTIFEQAVERRARREPLQYITGKQEFWGLDFLVNAEVLIPRPETELIIESVLNGVSGKEEPLRIVDLCTGSGCIAVSLAKELPAAALAATDASASALSVARDNARRHGVSDRIRFLEGDLFEPLEAGNIVCRVDIIVSNPPYVPTGDRRALQPEVGEYEPSMALFAGPGGTELHRRIIDAAPLFLKSGGTLIMEMGMGQAETIAGMIKKDNRYLSCETLKDLAGIERVVMAKRI